MSKTIEMIKRFQPQNEQEAKDKQFFIDCESVEQILTRENERCHLSASAFVINKERTKVLCAYHNIYKSWAWLGGHADGDDDMLYVATKEVKEESSLENFKPLLDEPISIESLAVMPHFKRGKFVPAHTHLNVTYLFVGDEKASVERKEDENSDVRWLTFEELLSKSEEPQMIPVYQKIISRIKNLQ